MSNLVTSGSNLPHEFNVIIEIPANSTPVKYEMDKDSGMLKVDRFVATGMAYPANYGFIPHTLSEDGDPVDVLVVSPFPLVHGCFISSRAIGVLEMEDESGIDAKIIALPTKKVCKEYEHIENLQQLNSLLLEQIKFFFENYKALEKGKWVKVKGWADSDKAYAEILNSVKRYQTSNAISNS